MRRPFANPVPWAFIALFLMFLIGSARAAEPAPAGVDPISGAAMPRPEALPAKEVSPPAPPAPAQTVIRTETIEIVEPAHLSPEMVAVPPGAVAAEAAGAWRPPAMDNAAGAVRPPAMDNAAGAPRPPAPGYPAAAWSASAQTDAAPSWTPPGDPRPAPARRSTRGGPSLSPLERIEQVWSDSRLGILSGNATEIGAAAATIRSVMDDVGIGGLPAHSAALLSIAATHAGRGNHPAARALAEAAVEVAPTSPEAWRELARHLIKSRTGQVLPVLHAWKEYGRALFASPAYFSAMAGNLLFYFGSALILVGAVIFIRPAARGFLILSEALGERLPSNFPPAARTALLAGAFAFPLAFPGGLGWLFLAVLLPVSVTMRHKERLGFALAVLIFAAAGPVLALCASFDAFSLSPALQTLAEAGRAEMGPRSLSRVDRELRLHDRDPALWGAKGLYEKLSGRSEEAEAAYERALALAGGAPAYLHNNLGNLLLARESYAAAGEHYRRAAEIEPRSAAIQFNLSQYFRSQMMFAEGEAAFRAAKALDPDLVGDVVFRTTSRETRNTVDLPMDAGSWWSRFFEDSPARDRIAEDLWRSLFPFAPLWTAPGLALLAAGVLLLQLRQDLRARKALCHRCGVVMEIPFKKREEERQTCPSCRALAEHPRELAPELRGRQLRRIERYQSMKRRLLRWGALTLPGSAHWMSGEVVRGALMLTVFFVFLMKWIAWEGRFRFAAWPRAEGMGPELILFMVVMGVLYYASFLKVRKL